jgi:hypothetical protein
MALLAVVLTAGWTVWSELTGRAQARRVRLQKAEAHRRAANYYANLSDDKWFDRAFAYDPTFRPALLRMSEWHARRERAYREAPDDQIEQETVIDGLHYHEDNRFQEQRDRYMMGYQDSI